MKDRIELHCPLRLASLLAAAGLAVGTAQADDVFDFEGYTVGALAGQSQPGGGACPCEYTGDDPASVDVFDLLGFLDLWFANAPGADIDGNPGVDVFDLLAFLDCWFPASAGNPCGGGGGTLVWEVESLTEAQPAEIVSGVNSPMDAGNQAVRWVLQPPSGNTTLHGVDLSQQYNSGIVEFSYDFQMGDFMNDRTGGDAGRNILRPRLLNKPIAAGAGNEGVGADNDLLFISYIRKVWTEKQAHLSVYSSSGGAGFDFQANVHPADSQVFSAYSITPRSWMRVKHYFDYNDAGNPGRLLYSALYDINDGVERRVAERRPTVTPVLGMSPTASMDAAGPGIAAIQLDMNIFAFVQDNPEQVWHLDNLAVRQVNGFVAPPALDQLPPPVARPPQDQTRTQTAQVKFNFADLLGGVSPGATPALEAIGNDLYTYDASNNLLRWDLTGVNPPAFMGFTSAASGTANVGTMASSADGSKLYFTSTGLAGEWGALYVYDIATQSDGFMPVYDSFARNYGDGQHSAARYTVAGETDRVFAAWRGAQFFDAYPADGVSAAGGVGGIGNRWDGGCCEGDAPNTIFALFRTGTDGLRSSVPNPQGVAVQNAIYRLTFEPGGGSPLFEPVSPSLQVLPWLPPAPDGSTLGTHRMQYVPQTNSIWVVRGSGSNHIGVYDIDTDDWRIIEVFLPDASPFAMDKTDIELAGDEMLIMSEGQPSVYALDAINLGALPTGACCVGTTCSIVTSADCSSMGGTYFGDNSACDTYSVTAGTTPIEDISATGTNLIGAGLGDDNEIDRALPFNFDFYGQTFSSVGVGSNGYLRMGAAQPCNNCWANNALPTQDSINNAIFPMWFDFSPQIAPGGAFDEVRGTAPNRRYILQFDAVTRWNGGGLYESMNTFQVILYEGSNNIEFRYGTLQEMGATVGVENAAGTWAVPIDFSTISAGDSFLLTPVGTCD